MIRFVCLFRAGVPVPAIPSWAGDASADRVLASQLSAVITADRRVHVQTATALHWESVVAWPFVGEVERAPSVDRVAAELGADVALLVRQHLLMDEPTRRGGAKLVGFLRRSPRLDLAEFESYWRDVHAPIAQAQQPAFVRYAMSIVIKASDEGFRWDGITEQWFPTSDALMDHVSSRQEASPSAADMLNFVSEVELFVADPLR